MGFFSFIFLFIVGLLFFWPGMVLLFNGLRGRKWPKATARVTHSRIDEKMYRWRGSNWTENIPEVRYSYAIAGDDFLGEQTHFGKYKKDKLQEIVSQYPIGKEIEIRHHPRRKHISLIRSLPISFHVYFFIGLGIVLWIAGTLFWIYSA